MEPLRRAVAVEGETLRLATADLGLPGTWEPRQDALLDAFDLATFRVTPEIE